MPLIIPTSTHITEAWDCKSWLLPMKEMNALGTNLSAPDLWTVWVFSRLYQTASDESTTLPSHAWHIKHSWQHYTH